MGDKLTAFAPHTTGVPLKKIAASEIAYRGSKTSHENALEDTIAASIVIASKGKSSGEDYPVYLDGIRRVTTHIFAVCLSCKGRSAAQ